MEDHTTAPAVAEPAAKPARVPWNKGKLVGAKPPLRPSHVWSIRTKLQIEGRARDPTMFNLAPAANFMVTTWRMNGRFAPTAAAR